MFGQAIVATGKFFGKHPKIGLGISLSLPGAFQAVVSHPFEHAQTGRQGVPKYITVKDRHGIVVTQKNPARFASVKIPALKPIQYDRGDYGQHLIARIPKSMVNSIALFGAWKALPKIGIPKF